MVKKNFIGAGREESEAQLRYGKIRHTQRRGRAKEPHWSPGLPQNREERLLVDDTRDLLLRQSCDAEPGSQHAVRPIEFRYGQPVVRRGSAELVPDSGARGHRPVAVREQGDAPLCEERRDGSDDFVRHAGLVHALRRDDEVEGPPLRSRSRIFQQLHCRTTVHIPT